MSIWAIASVALWLAAAAAVMIRLSIRLACGIPNPRIRLEGFTCKTHSRQITHAPRGGFGLRFVDMTKHNLYGPRVRLAFRLWVYLRWRSFFVDFHALEREDAL